MSPSATPATQNEGRCLQVPRLPRKVEVHGRQVPRLPRKVTVHVAKGHACHANSGGVYGVNWEPSAPPEPAQCHKCHACHAKWGSMSPKCRTCHAECTHMSPSTTPATQTAAASTASTGNQARHQSQPSAISATPAMQNARTCLQAPHLPRRMHVHVSKYHTCRANSGGVHAGNQARHQSQPSAISATPATQNACRSCVWTSCGRTSCVCERFGEDMLCVSKLCDDKLCVDKLCVDKLCEDKLCVSDLVKTSCV